MTRSRSRIQYQFRIMDPASVKRLEPCGSGSSILVTQLVRQIGLPYMILLTLTNRQQKYNILEAVAVKTYSKAAVLNTVFSYC
jgi:hypothetical protein